MALQHAPAGEGGAVSVRTTARLHLGFLDLNGALGRQFGSLGLSLDGPETLVVVRRDSHGKVTGAEQARARRYLLAIEQGLGLQHRHHAHVATAIQAHAGLGSGTQLALALAAAIRQLNELPPDPVGDAALLGRGARSGIGIALFASGGFVLDGGRGKPTRVPPLLARLAVPEAWRILLLHDPARQGLAGLSEREAFAGLAPMDEQAAGRLCRIALMQVLPALAERDLERFGAGITEIQQRVGAYFAPAQGGAVHVSPTVAAALRHLGAAGATGLGQTSWGPTGFAFVGSDAEAERMAQMLRRQPETQALEISIRRALNRGAQIATARLAPSSGQGTQRP